MTDSFLKWECWRLSRYRSLLIWLNQRTRKRARIALYEEALSEPRPTASPSLNLEDSEILIYSAPAMHVREWTRADGQIVTETISKTRGGGLGAAVGGVVAGPVGAVAGYAMSKKTTTSESRDVKRVQYRSGVDRTEVTICVTDSKIIIVYPRSGWDLKARHRKISNVKVGPARGRSLLGSYPNLDEVLSFEIKDDYNRMFRFTGYNIRNGYTLRLALPSAGFTSVPIPEDPRNVLIAAE